jgi:hypothetical protein
VNLLSYIRSRTIDTGKGSAFKKQLVCTYTLCVTLGALLAFDALAASNVRMPSESFLDLGTLLRFLAGVLLAFIAYWTRGIEKRVENAEHELKQQQTQISLMREQMLRDYITKHEIEKMHISIKESMDRMNDRLDYIIQPGPRRQNDDRGSSGYTHREG